MQNDYYNNDYENSNERQYNLSEYRRERTVRSLEKKPAGDFLFRVIIVQFIVFAIITGILFAMYKSGSAKFTELREMYNTISQTDMSVKEVFNKIKNGADFVLHPLDNVKSNGNAGETTSEEQKTTSEETTAEVENTTEVLTGAGGEDLILAKDKTSFSPIYLSEKAVTPVKNYKVTSKFGYRINPVTKEYGFHSGLDLAALEGSDIFAAFSGTVETADSSAVRGNYIIINHNNGVKTLYGHCSELYVKSGDTVRAGEKIAAVGSTGQATGPHLHFEIRINNVWCNPVWILDLQ